MKKFFIILVISLISACANVSVTKTADGFYPPTNPSLVKILKTLPDQKYIELGTVTASGFDANDVAKMHNALRSQSADLGANAVILTDEGLVPKGFGSYDRWGTGVAIVFTDED
jgi:hypothetical protein